MKKAYLFVSILMIVGIVIIGASAYKSFYYDKKQETTKNINFYLKEHNYERQVQKKEIRRDSKTAEYFAKVTFKDEPNNEYEIHQIGSNHFEVVGYKDGVQIADKKVGKYITSNWIFSKRE